MMDKCDIWRGGRCAAGGEIVAFGHCEIAALREIKGYGFAV
ncbi:MAG: hypothetical protein AAFP19_12265 [Bacteroidota bacterium]